MGKADYTAAVPLFQRSIQLDPNFAMAYAILGTAYHNLGEKILSAENHQESLRTPLPRQRMGEVLHRIPLPSLRHWRPRKSPRGL